MRDIAFFFVSLAVFPMTLFSPHIGILLWVWVALLSPNDLLFGFMAAVPFNKVVAGLTVIGLMINRERKKFYIDWLLFLVIAFLAVLTISVLLRDAPNSSGDTLYDRFVKQVALAVLICGIMWSRHRLHQLALMVAVSYGFMMVKEAGIFLVSGGGHTILGTGSTGDNNGLALAILMTIPLMLYVARYSEQWVTRMAIWVTAGLGIVTVVATFSRGGAVGLVVLTLMLLKSGKHRIRVLLGIAVLAAVVYPLLPETWFQRVETLGSATEDSSFMARIVAWKINTLIALDNPFFGGGPNASVSLAYWNRYLAVSMTFLFPTPAVNKSFVAHSIYFQVLGDTGFVGLTVFLSILATAFLALHRTKRLVKRYPSLEWIAQLTEALQISMVLYCICGAALSLVYFELLLIILAMISRTARTARELVAEERVLARVPRPEGIPAGRIAHALHP